MSGFCSQGVLLSLLIFSGISCYVAIRSRDGVIKQVRQIEPDLYRAVVFPRRRYYEADFTGFGGLFFYARFRRTILSKDFHELNPLRSQVRRVSWYTNMFIASLALLGLWFYRCS